MMILDNIKYAPSGIGNCAPLNKVSINRDYCDIHIYVCLHSGYFVDIYITIGPHSTYCVDSVAGFLVLLGIVKVS